ncbi:MAG: phosphatase PAP2 family protein [Deltaproteobacteria bacterium]|nr:phosphatase PAP2 family protein [Deltaproteobacteria bacterium]
MLVHLYLFTIAFLLITALIFVRPILPALDQLVYDINHDFLSDTHVSLMKQVTHLGDGEVFVVICLVIVLYFIFRQQIKQSAICVICAAALRLGNPFLKDFFSRERPVSTVSEATGFSYPSGHAANIAFLGLLIYSLLTPNLQQDFKTRLLISFIIFLVGLSRISLEVHWCSDVLAGWCLGLILGLIHLHLQRKVEECD